MLFIRPDKVRQIHSALITLSTLCGWQACQTRYVKILWLEKCVFYSHSGLFSHANSWCHIWRADLCCGFFSPVSVLWDTPPHFNPFKREGLIHSFSDGLSRSSPVHLLQGTCMDKMSSHSRAVCQKHQCAEQPRGVWGVLRKEAFLCPTRSPLC